ncbi:MAG TPA: hypothetical protein VM553_14030 [Dongiaceae bacterium]|nr:hypothetical protein [Dongiaceae bacterium]
MIGLLVIGLSIGRTAGIGRTSMVHRQKHVHPISARIAVYLFANALPQYKLKVCGRKAWGVPVWDLLRCYNINDNK